MEWTQEAPTAPGWYWYASYNFRPILVELKPVKDGAVTELWMFHNGHAWTGVPANDWAKKYGSTWAGPIQHPLAPNLSEMAKDGNMESTTTGEATAKPKTAPEEVA